MSDQEKPLVLICDDDAESIKKVSSILNSTDKYVILSATNGVEGLELAKQNSDKIRMVISDVHMPEMDGFDMISTIKSIVSDIKAIMITTDHSVETRKKLRKAGLNGYLPKPYEQSVMAKMIEDTMGE